MTIWQVRGLMVALAVLIALKPGFGDVDAGGPPEGSDLEVLVVVDRTVSMSALDHVGVRSRLEGVREDVTEVVQALPHARFALLEFGHDARLTVPFTSDPEAVLAAVDALGRERLLAGVGTKMDRPLPTMKKVLQRAASQHPDRRRVVLFLSDGENTGPPRPQASFASLAGTVDAGLVLGYGTPGGGLMPTGGEPPWTFVRDLRTGQDAVSRLDAANLQKIAGQLGVDYVHRTGPGGLEEWAQELRRGTPQPDGDAEQKYPLSWLLALVLLALALVEVRHDLLTLAEARGELHA